MRLLSNRGCEAGIETLARDIVGKETDIISLAIARAAAEADCNLAQIREVKAGLIQLVASATTATCKPPQSAADANVVEPMLRQLMKIDRYERAATARRQRAIQALVEQHRPEA